MIRAAYEQLFDRVLAFAMAPELASELQEARNQYVLQTGEVFDEDRLFEARMQGFLDWFVFDRPSEKLGDTPARAYPGAMKLSDEEAHRYRILARTVHGIFEIRKVR